MDPGDRVLVTVDDQTRPAIVQLVNRLVLVRPDEGPSVWRRPDELEVQP